MGEQTGAFPRFATPQEAHSMKKFALVAIAGLVLPALASAQTIGPDAYGYILTRTPNIGGTFTLTRTVGANMEFVVEYHAVQYFGATANTVTFEAVLRSNNTMSFYYPDPSGPAGQTNGLSASIGTHDLNGGGATNRYLQF